MRGKSIGRSHPRPCSGKKTLRRCRNNEEADKVILIDVDSENCNKVVIIDIPESLPKKNQESRTLKKDDEWLFNNVINIDDDETPDSSCPFGVNNVSFSAGTSLNRESFRVAKNFGDSTDSSDEDCQFVQDSATPVRLSKCKRTYSGTASERNRYGLDTDSECDLSDNDNPDCELMEDVSGKVQELWEKAFSRKRKDIHNVHSGIRGHDDTSRCINKDHQNAEPESKNATWHHGEASFCYTAKDDFGFTHLSDDAVHDQHYDKSSPCGKSNSQAKRCPSIHVKQADFPDCEPGSSSRHIQQNNSLQQEGNDGQLHIGSGDSSPPVIACIFNEREKLKETDEYKRAIEEEWASRQQALQIQAEEAQLERRLRKRRKAESMRLLDMEKRQKQRIEEMRSIQKKDEENMNLKDTIRAEVRNELKKLEVGCKDMASLLHKLGIPVGSGPTPSPQEVHAAYKRALLTFHPDRASRSDIRQQVEAEEKIKLINRLKEKFPPPL
ncbi:Chaperone DnaJ-domain superfamily protein [Perilla frutescens var. hirtella]|uniref:Chaperone DnaJ-domain superfamily protein n=1 Tax=Perilla frutescens var. hirtella TaxID=608512 RepID=A0AAD4JEI8_PERFH|nr:Chaperone DnaJ-domain superfamily protein [Perilla frutescens var. hirtella]